MLKWSASILFLPVLNLNIICFSVCNPSYLFFLTAFDATITVQALGASFFRCISTCLALGWNLLRTSLLCQVHHGQQGKWIHRDFWEVIYKQHAKSISSELQITCGSLGAATLEITYDVIQQMYLRCTCQILPAHVLEMYLSDPSSSCTWDVLVRSFQLMYLRCTCQILPAHVLEMYLSDPSSSCTWDVLVRSFQLMYLRCTWEFYFTFAFLWVLAFWLIFLPAHVLEMYLGVFLYFCFLVGSIILASFPSSSCTWDVLGSLLYFCFLLDCSILAYFRHMWVAALGIISEFPFAMYFICTLFAIWMLLENAYF